MADRKLIDDDGKVLFDDADVKIIYEGQVVILDGGAGTPEPPTENSVAWLSFF